MLDSATRRAEKGASGNGVPIATLRLLLSVYGIVFVAELPDKTALATLVLATRHRAMPVLLGTCLALSVQSVVAVAAGQLLSLLPARAVHIGSGVVFFVSAVLMWRGGADEEQAKRDDGSVDSASWRGFWRSAWLVFGVVFVAEWGDLTQLATAALAARYAAPLLVLAGATAALWSVAGIAVFLGRHAGRFLDPRATRRVAAALFAAVGVALVTGVL